MLERNSIRLKNADSTPKKPISEKALSQVGAGILGVVIGVSAVAGAIEIFSQQRSQTPTDPAYGITLGDTVIYKSSDRNADVIRTLPGGQPIAFMAEGCDEVENQRMFEIRQPGQSGWVLSGEVAINPALETSPLPVSESCK